MASFAEVTADDIAGLSDVDLANLLCRLIGLECDKHGIAARHHVSLNIKTPDGGEDGRVAWVDGPDRTHYLPSRLVLFQVKKRIDPSELKNEVIDLRTGQIKTRILDVLTAGGAYIVFCGNDLVQAGVEARITAIQESLKAHGFLVEPSKICVLDANGARDWANRYAAAVCFVLAKAGRHHPEGMDFWESTSRYPEHTFTYERGDLNRDSAEGELRRFLLSEEKVARVYGLAGLGKTRLVIEASRPDPLEPKFSGVVFADANHSGATLPLFIKQCRLVSSEGCLVVDNCDAELHEALQRQVMHSDSKLQLLTIGNDTTSTTRKIPQIELQPVNATVIKKQLVNICPGLPAADIDFIVDQLAEGFPHMAVLLAQARLDQEQDIRKIVGKDLVAKLLGIDVNHNLHDLRVLTTCAIFEKLGFSDEKATEYRTISELEGIDPEQFFATVKRFLEKGVITRRGRYIEIRPRPLAWRLAADWWTNCSPQKAQALSQLQLPESMVTALCERVRMLDGVKECVDLTKDLCAATGPFGQAELLNSEMGSKLFRAFCEVNPSACTLAIHRSFIGWPTNVLKKEVGPGRRYLVWALERLCFWPEHFNDAGRVLLNFATAENEDWSNNSTGILTGFFSALLSGTQALPTQRIDLAREALASPELAKKLVGIACLGKALGSRGFSRLTGSERQGARPPLQEWRPKYWQEIFDYWDLAVAELVNATQQESTARAASLELTLHLRDLFLNGRLDTMGRALEALLGQGADLAPRVVDALRTIERYDLGKAPADAVTLITQWQERFIPTNPEDQLMVLVSQAPWDHEERENGEFVDVSAERAIALAQTLALQPDAIIRKIDTLLFGEQRQTYTFAAEIGKRTEYSRRIALTALRRYRTRESKEWNPSFLAGLIEGISRQQNQVRFPLDKFLRWLVTDSHFLPLAVPVMIAAGLNPARLSLLVEPIARGLLEARYIRWLAPGRASKDVPTLDLVAFCLRCSERGGSFAWAALDILFMHCHGDKERWGVAAQGFSQLLLVPALFEEGYNPNTMDLHHFETVSERLLENGSDDFGMELATVIARVCVLPAFRYNLHEPLGKVALKLLQRNPRHFWPVLAEPLVSPEWDVRDAMAQTLGNSLGDKAGESAIKVVPIKVLLEWCAAHPTLAPQALIQSAPLFAATDHSEFSELVQTLLVLYGTSEALLSAISVNMFSFGWVGTPTPYYERLRSAVGGLVRAKYPQLVRLWAQERILELDQRIEQQKVEDVEGF